MRYIPVAILSAACVASPLAAKAGDMSLAVFLPKAEALMAKGPLAVMSSDMGVVKGEVDGATKSYRARIARDRKAGKAPHSCPPKKGAMTRGELMKHFGTYSAARRTNTTVRMAFFDLMKKKYPC